MGETGLIWLVFVAVIQVPLALLAGIDGYLMYMTAAELLRGVSFLLLVDAAAVVGFSLLPGLLASLLVLARLARGETAIRALMKLHVAAFVVVAAYWLAHTIKRWLWSVLEIEDPLVTEGGLAMLATLVCLPAVLAIWRGDAGFAKWRTRILSLRTLAISILTLAVAGTLSADLSVYQYQQLKARERAPLAKSAPNIFLVTIDTLTAEDMSLYGYPIKTTPHLERFAEASHVFANFFANSNFTTPAITSLLTGQHVDSHRMLQLEGRLPAGAERQNFAQVLSDAGYLTAAFVANPYAHPLHTRMAGSFDYLAFPPRRGAWGAMLARLLRLHGLNLQPLVDSLLPWLEPVLSRINPEPGDITPFPAEEVYAQAERFLGEQRIAAPLFVWVHIMPPHDPYLPPPPFLYSILPEKILDDRSFEGGIQAKPPRLPQAALDQLRLRYDEHIRYADSETGRFLDYLATNGYLDTSVVLVAADHGESFGRGWLGHNGPYLYQPLIHVPLIVHLPGQTKGSRIAAFGEHADIGPTVLDLIGLARAPWMEGASLLPAIHGQAPAGSAPKFSMNLEKNSRFGDFTTGTVAVMADGYKYIRYLDGAKSAELYKLANDPHETNNLAGSSADLVMHFEGLIRAKLGAAWKAAR